MVIGNFENVFKCFYIHKLAVAHFLQNLSISMICAATAAAAATFMTSSSKSWNKYLIYFCTLFLCLTRSFARYSRTFSTFLNRFALAEVGQCFFMLFDRCFGIIGQHSSDSNPFGEQQLTVVANALCVFTSHFMGNMPNILVSLTLFLYLALSIYSPIFLLNDLPNERTDGGMNRLRIYLWQGIFQ